MAGRAVQRQRGARVSRGEVVAAGIGLAVVVALILLIANAIRGQDVSWRMSYTTRRRRRRRLHALDRDPIDDENDDGGNDDG